MSLSTLRAMQFTALTDEEAATVSGEGKKPSRAQCAAIYAQSFNPMPCGGSPTDYYKLWKSLRCDKLYGRP
ncbi:hypothetical protein [Streptomyces sp. KLOTTS4A1]|uniref:hypothetical protein n=1 Tax=Streptomyces sp. KLOTTS4A1 TaxID=3390996 RepID=UPI0039F4A812